AFLTIIPSNSTATYDLQNRDFGFIEPTEHLQPARTTCEKARQMAYDVDTTNWPAGTRYFTQITEYDHSGWLYIITLLSFIYVVITFIIRFVVKYGMYGLEDWALLAATVLAVGQYIAVLAGLSEGLGKSTSLLDSAQISKIEQYASAHVFLYFLAHCGSKISTALLTRRLFENGRPRNAHLCWGLVAFSAVYGLGCILSTAIGCPSPGYVTGAEEVCPNRFVRWQIILALDIVSEALLVFVPLFLIMEILIKHAAKITVTLVFAFRLVDVLFAAMNLHQVGVVQKSDDPGVAIVQPLIWTVTELLWSIIAASLPCLKSFMKPFDKIDEETWRSQGNMYSSSRSGGRSWKESRDRDGAVPLEAIRGQRLGNVISASGNERSLSLRPEPVGNDLIIRHSSTNGSTPDDIRRSWCSQDRNVGASTHWEARRDGTGRDPYEIP
ncbi:hypothetical protein AC579_890, partial [Pseudocercospora musae]